MVNEVSTSPHFFKPILPDTLLSKMLKIPDTFVSQHGHLLGDNVFIKVPSGDKWFISLKKHDGQVWFHNGWELFAKFYSLSPEYFLLFRHEGNSHFHVIIFDPSSSEIHYPFIKPQNDELVMHEMKDGDTDVSSDEDFDINCSKATNENFVSDRSTYANRKMKSYCSKPEIFEDNNVTPCPTKSQQSKVVLEKKEPKFKAIERAKVLKSENHCFAIVMRASYCNYLHIPKDTADKCFSKECLKVRLETSDGKVWKMKYIPYGRPRFSFGWNNFVNNNNLEAGDVCIFEIKNGNNLTIKVTILRDKKL